MTNVTEEVTNGTLRICRVNGIIITYKHNGGDDMLFIILAGVTAAAAVADIWLDCKLKGKTAGEFVGRIIGGLTAGALILLVIYMMISGWLSSCDNCVKGIGAMG